MEQVTLATKDCNFVAVGCDNSGATPFHHLEVFGPIVGRGVPGCRRRFQLVGVLLSLSMTFISDAGNTCQETPYRSSSRSSAYMRLPSVSGAWSGP